MVALALLGEDRTREFWGLLITGSERRASTWRS